MNSSFTGAVLVQKKLHNRNCNSTDRKKFYNRNCNSAMQTYSLQCNIMPVWEANLALVQQCLHRTRPCTGPWPDQASGLLLYTGPGLRPAHAPCTGPGPRPAPAPCTGPGPRPAHAPCTGPSHRPPHVPPCTGPSRSPMGCWKFSRGANLKGLAPNAHNHLPAPPMRP